MSGYLHRLASGALSPGGSIHPVLGSVFSASTYRRMPEDLQEESTAMTPRMIRDVAAEPDPLISNGPSLQTLTPASGKDAWRGGVAEERPSFKPLVKRRQPEEFQNPGVPSVRMNYEDRGLDRPKDAPSDNMSELVTPPPDTPRIYQNAVPGPGPPVSHVPPLLTVTSVFGKGKQNESAAPASEQHTSFNTLVTKVRKSDIEGPEVGLKARPEPIMPESFRRINPRQTSYPFTPDARKESQSDRSRSLGLRETEPDEIQIHIGRIEVTAVPPAPARPEIKPVRKSLDLNEYLKRRGGWA